MSARSSVVGIITRATVVEWLVITATSIRLSQYWLHRTFVKGQLLVYWQLGVLENATVTVEHQVGWD